jgi:hypothetical protein
MSRPLVSIKDINKVELIEYLSLKMGNLLTIEQDLGITRKKFFHYIELCPDVKESYLQSKAKILDLAEANTIKAMLDGDVKVSQEMLKMYSHLNTQVKVDNPNESVLSSNSIVKQISKSNKLSIEDKQKMLEVIQGVSDKPNNDVIDID